MPSTKNVSARQRPVYLDYAATTPVDPRVAHQMSRCLMFDGHFGNPASHSHAFGWEAEELVEVARTQLASLINADPREIVWTSGATESDNLAIKGIAENATKHHMVTSSYEHKAVIDTFEYLETKGFEVTYLEPNRSGFVRPETVADAIREDTLLVSIMHANNEIGVVNEVGAIGEICRENGVLMHTDAAQSAGKISLDVKAQHLDLVSISGHKIYGPKGIGALYVRREPPVPLDPCIHGGGHERGMRSGTLATHQIVGFGEAARICLEEMSAESERIGKLRERLWSHLKQVPGVSLNGDAVKRIPGILNVGFDHVDGETLLMALDDIAVSSGSACTSATVEPSYVLRSIGVDERIAASSLRFTVGRFTTEDDVDYAARRVSEIIQVLQVDRV